MADACRSEVTKHAFRALELQDGWTSWSCGSPEIRKNAALASRGGRGNIILQGFDTCVVVGLPATSMVDHDQE